MGLFSRQEPEPAPAPVVEEQPKRHHGFFSGRRSPSPTGTAHTTSTSRSSLSSTSYHTSPERAPSNRRSLLHRFGGNAEMDPSIVAARERVLGAEAAERDADRALIEARRSVADARSHVKRLEDEAREEARLAKIKQYHAREVSKRGKQLGRHGE